MSVRVLMIVTLVVGALGAWVSPDRSAATTVDTAPTAAEVEPAPIDTVVLRPPAVVPRPRPTVAAQLLCNTDPPPVAFDAGRVFRPPRSLSS